MADDIKKKAKAWERIEFEGSRENRGQPAELFRLSVPGGWLVAAGWGLAPGPLVFVADAAHAWSY